jgi:hypothetical protein
MRDGCNRCTMHGEMNNKHRNSFNRMRQKRNVKDGINRGIYGKGS